MDHDELINQALGTYSNTAPSAGFEQRILRQSHGIGSRWSLWLAVPATAVALFLVWPRPVEPPRLTVSKPQPAIQSIEAHAQALPVASAPQLTHARLRKTRTEHVAKLTVEEKAWLSLAVQSPRTVAGLVAWKERLEMPLEIKSLEIEPIAMEELIR